MVHIVGVALKSSREAQGISQRGLSAAYAAARANHPTIGPSAIRAFPNATLSALEKSVPGQRYGAKQTVLSHHQRDTALILAKLLKMDIDELILEIAREPIIFTAENSTTALPSPLRLLGPLDEQPSVELTFIPGAHRTAFFGALAAGVSYLPTETRRQYLRGAPSDMYAGRVVFAIAGDSMEPYFEDGDEVIAVAVHPLEWAGLRNRVVVVACAQRVAVAKIIDNNLDATQQLTLLPYRTELASRTVGLADIRAIWLVETKLPKAETVRL